MQNRISTNSYAITRRNSRAGFTLLLSILVGVVVLTIGLTILNSALKQLVLSDISLESERAFHAAYAGVECAQYWNNADTWDVGASTLSIRCMSQDVTTNNSPLDYHADDVFTAQFDWSVLGSAPEYQMCTDFTVYKYYDALATTLMTILPVPDSDPIKTCNIGVECTVVVSRGYNRSCANLADVRTVEREITIRF